jgi:iron-sulfur cluster assembly accessory protein
MIELTESAMTRIDEICKAQNVYAVTLNVTGGGCSGFQYDWGLAEFESDIIDDEEVFEAKEGKLAVGIMSLAYLAGSKVDYVQDIMGSQFEIVNPNAQSGCGCGASVSF